LSFHAVGFCLDFQESIVKKISDDLGCEERGFKNVESVSSPISVASSSELEYSGRRPNKGSVK